MLKWLYDEGIVVERGAHDCKLYCLDDDDPEVGSHGPDAISFEVEEILQRRGTIDDQEYLIKWAGFLAEFNSWVERQDLDGALAMRDAFDKDHPLKEELDIVHEPIPQAVLEPVHVACDQIVLFIAL